MRRLVPLAAVAAVVGCGGPTPSPTTVPAPSGPVEVIPVTVGGLMRAVAEQRGRVVLLDVWFLDCPPCRKGMPHLVEMHRKYGPKGLKVMTVDIELDDNKRLPAVQQFLAEVGASFPNFVIKDDPRELSDWQDKYDANATPQYVLFDKSGRWHKLPVVVKDADIERIVEEKLAE